MWNYQNNNAFFSNVFRIIEILREYCGTAMKIVGRVLHEHIAERSNESLGLTVGSTNRDPCLTAALSGHDAQIRRVREYNIG